VKSGGCFSDLPLLSSASSVVGIAGLAVHSAL
jgi:hypothetical protein